ncbi:MAG: branched chain amino acid aminotransferase [Acidobacteria bacterium]|nr:MAG: branched chain amino acid aminotransferase [Acidobacteriota bacterium]PYQ85086.1 MAG: branched chain amino acid aminotransferase [Acidobacteriota bacterium]
MAFPGTGKIWMNGKLVEWKDATIHVASHVIHYGSGVFEGARCYATPRGSACFRLDAHMRRLQHSMKIYRMEYPLDLSGWIDAVTTTIRTNQMKACYIRPIVYRGYETLGVNPFTCPVDAAIILWEWGTYLGQEALELGVDVKVATWSRVAPNTLPAMAKSSANYANSGLIKMEAITDGYAEGIALDVYGNVSEGSGQNLFIVRDGELYTPALGSSILGGITRDSIITLAREHELKVTETTIPREALYLADEVFFVGTAAEVTPIRSIDKIEVGGGRRGPITERLQRAFFDVINGEVPDRHGWLTYVYQDEALRRAPQSAVEARG